MRANVGAVTMTVRFAAAPRARFSLVAGLLLAALACGLSYAEADDRIMVAAVIGSLVTILDWGQAKRRGLWTVTVFPTGTLLSVCRGARLHYTLCDTVDLRMVDFADTERRSIRVNTLRGRRLLIQQMPLLTLCVGDERIFVPLTMLNNRALLAAMRRYTAVNETLNNASLPFRTAVLLGAVSHATLEPVEADIIEIEPEADDAIALHADA